MPDSAAGWRIDPPVSVPVAPMQRFAATAAAEPPDDPPGTTVRLEFRGRQGLVTGSNQQFSFDEPMANSSMLVLPSNTAPAFHRFCVTVDSYGGTKFSRMRLPAVVRTSLVQKRSLMAKGMPSSARASPVAMRRSDCAAI